MFDLVGFSEIDKSAVEVYCELHDVSKSSNFGDIKNISKAIVTTNVDLLVGGTPCQNFSTIGTGAGCCYNCHNCGYSYNPLSISVKNREHCPKCGKRISNKTQSSLLVEYLRVVRELKPKMLIWENVLSVATNKNFEKTFTSFIKELESYGYIIRQHKTNAVDFGIPQHRRRIFIIGVHRFFSNGCFNFRNEGYRKLTIDDILQSAETTETNLWLSDYGNTDTDIIEKIYNFSLQKKIQNIYNAVGYIPQVCGLRNREDHRRIPCITTNSGTPSGDGAIIVKQNNRLRKITPLECFRSMGYTDEDYNKCISLGISEAVMRKLTGNSIVVDVAVAIYRDLYKSQPHLFTDDLKVVSVCSGIGAFERALNLFYEMYYKPTEKSENKYAIKNCLLQYPDMLTTSNVCEILDIHRNTVQIICEKENIERITVGNKCFVSKSSLITYLNRKY